MAGSLSAREVMDLRKKKQRDQLQNQSAPIQPFQGRGGFAVTPSGQSSDGQGLTLPGVGIEAAKKFGPAAAKMLADRYFASQPTQADIQGSDPNAFAQQRAGERMDFSPSLPTSALNYSNFTPSADLSTSYGSLNPAQQNLFNSWAGPDVNIPTGGMGIMPSQTGDLGVSGVGAAGGAEGAAGGAGGWAGGLGALGGAAGSFLASLASKGLHLDPTTGAIVNAAGGIAGTIGTGAALGAAGVGAAGAAAGGGLAGAAAGAAAAGSGALVAAPIAAGMIMQAILEARDTGEAIRETKIRLRNIQSQMPGEVSQIRGIENIVNSLNENSSKEDLVGAMKQLNGIQHGYQEGGWESYQKAGGTVVGGGSAGKDISVALPGVKAQLDALNPYWGQLDTGRINAENTLMGREGMNAGEVEQATGRFINPIDVITSYSPETRAALFNAPPGTTAEQSTNFNGMPSAGLMPGTSLMAPVPEGWTPGVQGTGYIDTPWGLANRQLYEELYGLQSSPNYKSDMIDLMQRYGTQLSPDFTAALPSGGPGGLNVGGVGNAGGNVGATGDAGRSVGRLAPANPVTGLRALPRPEADARSEGVFGMRKPAPQGPADQSGGQPASPPAPGTSAAEPTAFGMAPRGGFAVYPGGRQIGTGGLVQSPAFGVSQRPFGGGAANSRGNV